MSADAQIKEILSRYGEDLTSNTWVVPGGKARAIFHKTIERMAAKAGITFDPPQIVSTEADNVVVVVTGRLGDRTEWSFGEASPKNNKNAYPWSMAEKRGKDRVALKLIGLHGLLYSEEEADEFKNAAPMQPANSGSSDDRTVANTLIAALKQAKSAPDLAKWFGDNSATIEKLPDDLKDEVRGAYAEHLHGLRRAA